MILTSLRGSRKGRYRPSLFYGSTEKERVQTLTAFMGSTGGGAQTRNALRCSGRGKNSPSLLSGVLQEGEHRPEMLSGALGEGKTVPHCFQGFYRRGSTVPHCSHVSRRKQSTDPPYIRAPSEGRDLAGYGC